MSVQAQHCSYLMWSKCEQKIEKIDPVNVKPQLKSNIGKGTLDVQLVS